MDLLSERQAQSQMHLREKYMQEIRQRKLERDRRKQERIDNGLLDDSPKRVDSASSDSSKDEGVHSNGEKAEDDINEDDLAQSGIEGVRKYAGSELDDDEDEGMGSMAGERIKDDPDEPDDERSRPLTAISESKLFEPLIDGTESALSVIEKDDDLGGSTGYSADMEDDPEPRATEAEPEAGEAEPDAGEAEPEEAESAVADLEAEPEAAEAEPEAAEADPEAEPEAAAEAEPEAAEAEPEAAEAEYEAAEPEEAEAESEAAEAEPEAAEIETEAAEAETEATKAEPESIEAEPETTEGEPDAAETEPEVVIIEPDAGSEEPGQDEARDIPAPEKPPDTSRRKRKKKIFFDLNKVTANRKPLSIRTEPLEKPSTAPDDLSKKAFIRRASVAKAISSKKENENFKPHLKSKYELQRQNRLKYNKVKLKKPVLSNTQNESSNPDGSTDSSLAPVPPVELIVSEVTAEEEAEKADFVNPLMDHSVERPIAPHQRKLIESPSAQKMKSGSSKSTEVYVPGEDQLYVYSYSSLPRLLHIKRLGGKRVATTYSNDTDPNSSFRIKNRSGRVIRGTNFGKDGAPKWNPYFAYARCLSANDYAFYETDEMRQRRDEFRERMKTKAKERREHLGVSNIFRTTNGPTANHSFTSLTQLDSSVSAEVAVIKALVSNILREAAVEVAREAEADGAKMEELAARRLSIVGEADATKLEDTEEEVRKDPEGEETPALDTEAPPEEAPPEEAPPDEPDAEPAEEEAQAESNEANAEDEGESEDILAKGEAQTEMEEVPAG